MKKIALVFALVCFICFSFFPLNLFAVDYKVKVIKDDPDPTKKIVEVAFYADGIDDTDKAIKVKVNSVQIKVSEIDSKIADLEKGANELQQGAALWRSIKAEAGK